MISSCFFFSLQAPSIMMPTTSMIGSKYLIVGAKLRKVERNTKRKETIFFFISETQ
jgi:hypothetical protein